MLQSFKHFLCHIVFADRVFQGEIEFVILLNFLPTGVLCFIPSRASLAPTISINIHSIGRQIFYQLMNQLFSLAQGDAVGDKPGGQAAFGFPLYGLVFCFFGFDANLSIRHEYVRISAICHGQVEISIPVRDMGAARVGCRLLD